MHFVDKIINSTEILVRIWLVCFVELLLHQNSISKLIFTVFLGAKKGEHDLFSLFLLNH